MNIIFKIVFVLFSGLVFFSYGWSDVENLSYTEKFFRLSPGYGLFIMGVVPLLILRKKGVRELLTIVLLFGAGKTIDGVVEATLSPIEADVGAIKLNVIILMLIISGVYFLYKRQVKKK